jgi:hypothetical protein
MYFENKGNRYSIQIVTGPRSVLLSLVVQSERTEAPVVEWIADRYPYRSPEEDVIRRAVLEGTDAANAENHTNFHPAEIVCAVESWDDGSALIRRAAHAIVERLALQGTRDNPSG